MFSAFYQREGKTVLTTLQIPCHIQVYKVLIRTLGLVFLR